MCCGNPIYFVDPETVNSAFANGKEWVISSPLEPDKDTFDAVIIGTFGDNNVAMTLKFEFFKDTWGSGSYMSLNWEEFEKEVTIDAKRF